MPVLERKQTVLKILEQLRGLDALKELFWTELNYERENKPLSMRGWPDSARKTLVDDPILFASGGEDNAFHVLYCRLASDSLQRNLERPIVNQLIREHPYCLFVFSDTTQSSWHFLNIKYDEKAEQRRLFRRITVRADGGLRTAAERLQMLDLVSIRKELFSIPALEIQKRHDDAFDVEKVTKDFYKELANWYFWALKHIRFPKDAPKEADGHDHISVIRMITRLIFCWFVKEKGLIPDELFDQRRLDKLLNGFTPDNNAGNDSVFYKAILQNLFFATLNTEMDKRGWAKDEQNFMAHSLYRYRDLFQKPDAVLALFKNIPFLNGGLFECLDKDLSENARPRYVRIDGFSRRPDSQPVVPDFLFFGSEREEDLSADYGDKKFRKVRVRGLIHTLHRYRFTIEENTPIEQEVALDPELSGKVFENLLAAYNPETGATARKQTGSFYTPREIVDYMVDEALIAFLKGSFPTENAEATEKRLRRLASWEESGHDFDNRETETLIAAIDRLKALDPAVGSGAFPMGILHKLVFILGKLDPRNERWKQRQIRRVRDAIETAEKIEDAAIRERTVRELEQQIVGIEEAFERNELDYGRKLYLIENCLYGVDIQSIAVQIAKMRFFISLIVDQRVDTNTPNLGVRPLPNLETKFVAANTLIGIEKPKQALFRNPDIDAKEAELRKVREKHFNAKTPGNKAKYRDMDKKLRTEVAGLLKRDGWGDTTAKRLATWDPYNQNASAPFFDPEWMFGISKGFDVVIGNPPYVPIESMTAADKAFYQSKYPCLLRKYDSSIVFILAGLDFLNGGGVLAYISSITWQTGENYSRLREILFTRCGVRTLVNLPFDMFKAAYVDTGLYILSKQLTNGYLIYSFPKTGDLMEMKGMAFTHVPASLVRPPEFKVVLDLTASMIIFRIRDDSTFTTLDEISTSTQGLAGNMYKPSKKDKPSDLFPFVEQGQVYRYVLVVGSTFPVDMSDKKSLKRYYDYGEKILIRRVISRDNRLMATASEERLVFKKDVNPFLILDKRFTPEFVLGLLNSKLLSYLYLRTSSIATKDDFRQTTLAELRALPIPRSEMECQRPIVDLVSRILAAKTADPSADTSALENEIDRMVYELYGLTEEEIAIVESRAT